MRAYLLTASSRSPARSASALRAWPAASLVCSRSDTHSSRQPDAASLRRFLRRNYIDVDKVTTPPAGISTFGTVEPIGKVSGPPIGLKKSTRTTCAVPDVLAIVIWLPQPPP